MVLEDIAETGAISEKEDDGGSTNGQFSIDKVS